MRSDPSLVTAAISKYLREQGQTVPDMLPSSRIMADLGLDSLALAVIVINLQESTGRDPFSGGFREFTTIEELASLFAE